MHVYIVFHLYGDLGYSICSLCCTQAQAERICGTHPPVSGATFGWRKYRLEGFPWVGFAVLALLACFGALILARVLF